MVLAGLLSVVDGVLSILSFAMSSIRRMWKRLTAVGTVRRQADVH